MDEKCQDNDGKLSIVAIHSAKDFAEIGSESIWDNGDNFLKIEENGSSYDKNLEETCEKGIFQEKKKTQIRYKLNPSTAPIPVVSQSQVLLKGKKDQVILHSSKSSIRGPVMINQISNTQSCVLPSTPVLNANIRPVACRPNTNLLKSGVVYLNQGIPGQPILNKNQTLRTINNNTTPIFIPEKSIAPMIQPNKISTPPFHFTNNLKSTAISSNNIQTGQQPTKSFIIPPLPLPETPLQPKPGQILLQTADGQKLLLQPISGNLNNHQIITPVSSYEKKSAHPVNMNVNTNIRKPNLELGNNSHVGKVIFLPNPSPISISTSNRSVAPKQINDSTSPLDTKSVLMNMLTENRKIPIDSSISENIEVFNDNNTNVADEKNEWVEKCSGINQVPNRQTFKKKKNDEIYFSKISGNKKGSAEDVACFLPLQACGSATLEHLISLTENKMIKSSEVNHISAKDNSQTVSHDTSKQPCASRILKDTFKDLPTKHISGGSRRKQILTNRTAEAEESFFKVSNKVNYLTKKNRRHPISKPRTCTVESDEIISSISDFDLVRETFASDGFPNVAVDKSPSNLDAFRPELQISQNLTDTLSLKISDVCSLKIEDDSCDTSLCNSSTNQSMKRNCDTVSDDNLVNIKKIKTEPGTGVIEIKNEPKDVSELFKVGQILSSDDLVRRSYRIFSKPSYQSGNISTEKISNPKEFIPITNILNAKVGLNRNTEKETDSLSCYASAKLNHEAPFDYSSFKGPISIKLTGMNEKSLKKYMGLKSCYVKAVSDFNIIESRFAINGVRKVYSCNHCKGEYATVNVKSLAEHIEMHKRFPKLHMLVQERPYEVTAVSGKELSDMVSDSKVLPGNSFVASTDRNRNKKHFCMLCPYFARSPLTLKSHRTVHNLNSKVTCDICGIVYRNSKVLEMHKTNEHKNELKKMVYISARPL